MMMMDPLSASNDMFNNFNNMSLNSPSDPDVDWSVFENADRYLLRDDIAWITRLSNDFWWNLERISELSSNESHRNQQVEINPSTIRRAQPSTKTSPQHQQFSSTMPTNNSSTRKIVGQRATSSRTNIPDTGNLFQNLSFFTEQDNEYNPFQSKISFDNHIWANAGQQAIPWQ